MILNLVTPRQFGSKPIAIVSSLLFFTLVIQSGCKPSDPSGSANGDSETASRVNVVRRGDQEVLVEMKEPDASGKMIITSRGFLVGGVTVMIEADKDRDGSMETVYLFNLETDQIEAVRRLPDGSVELVSQEELDAYKQQNDAISNFFEQGMNEDLNNDEVIELIEDTRAVVQEAQDNIEQIRSENVEAE